MLVPSAKPQRDRLAGVPQLVGVSAIVHGSSNDHPADTQRRDRLSRRRRILAMLPNVLLDETNHGAEYTLEGLFGLFVPPRYVAGKGDHRAGIRDVLEVLARQIGPYDLRSHGRGVEFDLDQCVANS